MRKIEKTENNQLPIFLFHQGTNYNSQDFFGVHFLSKAKKKAVFRVWAPNADTISVVGDFNNWNDSVNKLSKISDNGVWEVFVDNVKEFDNYKFSITYKNKKFLKADPYAFFSEKTENRASKVYDTNDYIWNDGSFINNKSNSFNKPMNIYEVNLASWKKHDSGEYYSYRELADELVDYVYDMGYTHIELMPLNEYPFDGSWGYQVTGYFSITSRFGIPSDFKYFIDKCHQKNISVILDWVPAHFPKDSFGLCEFDGFYCYENQGWDKIENKTWGTRLFDLGRNEVECFLISSAVFLIDNYHIDGLRVDAVASMLYLDYDRKEGEWIPNENGGNINLQAVSFLQKLNTIIFSKFPYALMIAEESTAYPLVTKPVDIGGLGFNYKWNMGWMNDILSYMSSDPYFRSKIHNKLTFSMFYAFSENFILPISHDEVVHGKKSLLDKMPGDIESKFSNLRAFNSYMMAHPGKKLSFMGNEYGQFKEWNFEEGLEFFLKDFDNHRKLSDFIKELNNIYKNNSELYEIDDSWDGFRWISADENDNNIISFMRINKNNEKIVVIVNFSGCDFESYNLGVESGKYKLILNSNDIKFGGSNKITKKIYNTKKIKAHNSNYSINIKLTKFTALYLKKLK